MYVTGEMKEMWVKVAETAIIYFKIEENYEIVLTVCINWKCSICSPKLTSSQLLGSNTEYVSGDGTMWK